MMWERKKGEERDVWGEKGDTLREIKMKGGLIGTCDSPLTRRLEKWKEHREDFFFN